MNKSLRLYEQWFRTGLWLVAFVFASFLIGLGNTVVGDLPKVEERLSTDDFLDRAAANSLRAEIKNSQGSVLEAEAALEQAQLQSRVTQADSAAARETFGNWLATRRATQLSEQDPELISRTRTLDRLKQAERAAQIEVEKQEQVALNARQSGTAAQRKLNELEQAAQEGLEAEYRRIELRVFLYRLALTLPLLAVAGWLFKTRRKSKYWPFVWGFIIFALFGFFVELVPYLPSYGGYVRYVVGIIVTALVGRQAILALNRYLERQKLVEQLPDAERRRELSYDVALARLTKSVCPGCERRVDLNDPKNDFCPHCGIGLYDHCGVCSARKGAFAKFCHSCGAVAKAQSATPGAI